MILEKEKEAIKNKFKTVNLSVYSTSFGANKDQYEEMKKLESEDLSKSFNKNFSLHKETFKFTHLKVDTDLEKM